ncbi:MAG: enoyl-CoA hydratase/isomerase family protein [Dehalococcoidia bacterium]
MAYTNVIEEQRGSVTILTLNRPERLNAWNNEMMFELKDAVTRANSDPAVRALVFTGTGRAYCSGADVGGWAQQIQAGGGQQGSATAGEDNWLAFLRRMPKPTIAAVNGVAVGVGVTHILPMDVRIASENARFGFAFVKMALVPELASSYFLPQLVGLGRAKEWCLTARMVPAEEAQQAGLVSEVVAHDRLIDRAVEIGEMIGAHAPAAVARVKQVFDKNATDSDIQSVLLRENAQNAAARLESDHKEAVAAFMEKRAPVFKR